MARHAATARPWRAGEHVLTPQAIDLVVDLSEREDVADQQHTLERERQEVEKRISRLVSAIESGGDVPSLVAKLRELETRLAAIRVEMAALRPIPRLAPAIVENRLSEWRRLLRASTTQGRAVLQRVLQGRLIFTPRTNPVSGEVDGYEFSGPTRFDELFTGIAVAPPADLDANDTTGKEDIGPTRPSTAIMARYWKKRPRERGGAPGGGPPRVDARGARRSQSRLSIARLATESA